MLDLPLTKEQEELKEKNRAFVGERTLPVAWENGINHYADKSLIDGMARSAPRIK